MSVETEGLEKIGSISHLVQFRWTLGKLSELLGIPKKQIRKAFRILETPEMEAVIELKGRKVSKTFHYGFYKFYQQRKKKRREISAPHPDLRLVFDAIKNWLDFEFYPHENAFGFVRGRNPKIAAGELLEKKHFYSIDIAEAFPSISPAIVEKTLIDLRVDEALAKIIAWFVTTYDQTGRRGLPQGASSSPILLNLVYKPMCEEMELLCKQNAIEWVAYVDDFTFAAKHITPEVKEKILAIPARFGFRIKAEKTKDNFGKTIPHMLGLTIVRGRIHIRRERKNEYRRILYEATHFPSLHSREKVMGIGSAIACVYGDEEEWPGWLLKPWQKYLHG